MDMAHRMKSFQNAALVILPLSLLVAGCGSKQETAQGVENNAVNMAKAHNLRHYYDISNGNFDALSPTDKQAVIELTHGEENARTAFGHLSTPNQANPQPLDNAASGK